MFSFSGDFWVVVRVVGGGLDLGLVLLDLYSVLIVGLVVVEIVIIILVHFLLYILKDII